MFAHRCFSLLNSIVNGRKVGLDLIVDGVEVLFSDNAERCSRIQPIILQSAFICGINQLTWYDDEVDGEQEFVDWSPHHCS